MGRRPAALLLIATLAVWTPGAAAQRHRRIAGTPLVLPQGGSVERTLAAGGADTFEIVLRAGDFLHVTVAQRGIDVVATLVGPDGQEIVGVATKNDILVPQTLVASAGEDGAYTIAVRAEKTGASRGRYALHVDEVRPGMPSDADRIEAERLLGRARTLLAAREPKAFGEALADADRARALCERVGDRRGETLATIYSVWASTIDRADLIPTADAAERTARAIGDDTLVAAALRVSGLAHEAAGEMNRALAAYQAEVALCHALGNRKAEAHALNDVGLTYGRMSEGEPAVAFFRRALALARATADTEAQTVVLNNLGIAYKDLGEFERALDSYRGALAADQALHRTASVVFVLNNMGNLEHRLHHDREALRLHVRSLDLSRQIGDKAAEARALNTIGFTYDALGDAAKALEYHRQALAMRRTLGDLPGEAASLDGEGEALHALRRDEEARAALDESLAIRRKIRDQTGEIEALRHVAQIDRDQGDLAAALGDITRAVDLEESMRGRITSPSLRSSFSAAEFDNYEFLIDTLQQQHAADPGGGHDAAALSASERARARTLLESAVGARVDLHEGIEASLLARERALQKSLDDASRQLSRALARDQPAAQRDAAAARVDELTRDYQQLLGEIRARSPRYAAMMHPEPLDTAAIQRTVLDDRTVLLEFALGAEHSWLWAVTRSSIRSVALPPRRTIEAAARRLYADLVARQRRSGEPSAAYTARVAAANADLARRSAAVSRMLFGSLARQLSGDWRSRRLAIVASGALEYLPFGALPSPGGPSTDAPPLAADHEIVMLPSASVLAVLRREAAARTAAPRSVAILADPVFERSDPRVVAAEPAAQRARWSGPERSSRAPARLPFSREEADAIAAVAKNAGVLEATGFRASRATVVSGALDRYRIVHFATHGIVDSDRPPLSSLVLSLVDEHGRPRDGYVRLHDIYNLHLDAELVVLSACQTALGKEIRGEGLVGLTRAFMYAGTPRVLATLWEVSDAATAELMKKFYQGLLVEKLRPAAALRAAQLEMRQDPRWRAPYFWAGFELQGDWK